MAAKSGKEPKFLKKESTENNSENKKPSAKLKKQLGEDDDPGEDEVESVSKKNTKTSKSKGVDDNGDRVDFEDEADDWNKADEDEDWDPDFAEFDLPKSKTTKKVPGVKKGVKDDDDDDFKIDDEFKDMFGSSSKRRYDDDDDF